MGASQAGKAALAASVARNRVWPGVGAGGSYGAPAPRRDAWPANQHELAAVGLHSQHESGDSIESADAKPEALAPRRAPVFAASFDDEVTD